MKKIAGYLKSCFSLRSSVIGTLALIFTLAATFSVVYGLRYEVEINDNGNVIKTYVYSKTVEDALKEAGIKIGEFDELSLEKNAYFKATRALNIVRAKEVTVALNGEEKTLFTTLKTVNELLKNNEITVSDDLYLVTPEETEISDGLNIEIIKKVYEEVTETEVIPFKTEKKANYNMESGRTRVSKNGADGEKKVTFRVLKHNGEILEKEVVEEEIIKKPVNKIIEYGMITASVTSRGESLRYKKVIDCKATAYCLKGRTASGKQSQRGLVAVDPNVIPLGTRLYIETASGSFVYGYAVAADTGGAIKGNKIDLFMDTKAECLSFGVRNVKVYILE